MKLLALLPLAALAADLVVASAVPARHHRIARALNRKRRCQARPQNTSAPQSSTTSPQVTYPTPQILQEKPPAATTTTTDSTPPKYNPPAQPQSGTISATSDCGDIGATCEFSQNFRIAAYQLIPPLLPPQPSPPKRVVPMGPSFGSTVASKKIRAVAGAHNTSPSTK